MADWVLWPWLNNQSRRKKTLNSNQWSLVGCQNQHSFVQQAELDLQLNSEVIYGTLVHSIVHMQASPFPGLWLVAGQ